MSLGLGSVVASIVGTAPWLAIVSRHKTSVFVAVGGLLAFNYWLALVRPRRLNCAPGEICYVDSPAMRFNRAMFWVSAVIYFGAIALTLMSTWWIRTSI